MNRFYAIGRIDDSHALLTAEDTVHARKVLRLSPGDSIEVIISNERHLAAIESFTDDNCVVSIGGLLSSTEPGLQFTLYQGLPKGEKMEFILQKATELGVVRFVPVIMSRCVVRIDEKDISRKCERWQKIVREACKQSGRCIIPEVTRPMTLEQSIIDMSKLDSVIVPWENCRNYGPKAFYTEHRRICSAGIVIGPEGGISEKEISLLTNAGALPVTLGPRILRTETAGIAVISALFGLYDEMEQHI